MLVLKFGGTSVGSPEGIEKIISILKDGEHRERTGVVVVSALSGITDLLIDISKKAAAGEDYQNKIDEVKQRHRDIAEYYLKGEALKKALAKTESQTSKLNMVLSSAAVLRELSPRTLDMTMSFGERMSACLIAAILCSRDIPSDYLDARPLIKTDNTFGKARFLPEETYNRIKDYFNSIKADAKTGLKPLQIATGFIGSTSDDSITTLGRGGSDLTGAIFAVALDAEELEIWTDVDGMLTADPRQVKNAFRIKNISYAEAMELSHFGAKVIYPPTVKSALEKRIPIRIRNTFNTSSPGTAVIWEAEGGAYPIRGISSNSNIALVSVEGPGMVGVTGFSARLFGAMARHGINIIFITQSSSEYSICFAVLPPDADTAVKAAAEEFDREISVGTIEKPTVEKDLSIIAVVGANMKKTSGISGKVFHALGRNGISVVAIAQGSSETNISAVISKQNETKALNAIHEAFFLSGVRSVNLFLMGTGHIGGTLLDQIAEHKEILADEFKISIKLVGVADLRGMLLDENELDPADVRDMFKIDADTETQTLTQSQAKLKARLKPLDLSAFVSEMKAMNLPNSCFCDCTASDDVAGWYAEILKSSIPIVTPNKRANSGPLGYYKTLTGFSRSRGIPYLYETTVGAGLPVISTLRDLYMSGDKVRRIEAVLSGTLSFIFNNFDGSKTFSSLVREAKEKGYTEPDPRDDLNAMDAARKALILARECGMPLEFSTVEIEPILPASCFEAKSVEDFFTELSKYDDDFENKRKAAAKEGKSLRYIAVIEENTARLSLRTEEAQSPFLSLTDSDNIVVIKTDRYSSLPMVIKGPGAGAQVTAGGIFADIVRIARTLV